MILSDNFGEKAKVKRLFIIYSRE